MQNDIGIELEQKANIVSRIWNHALVQAFLSDWITLVSTLFLIIVILAAAFAPLAAPYPYEEQQLRLRHLPPLSSGEAKNVMVSPPTTEQRFFLFGTDHLGRDMLTRLIYGGRISISVGAPTLITATPDASLIILS